MTDYAALMEPYHGAPVEKAPEKEAPRHAFTYRAIFDGDREYDGKAPKHRADPEVSDAPSYDASMDPCSPDFDLGTWL